MDNSKVTQYWEPDGNVDYPALRKPFVSSETESNTVTTNNKYVETDLVKRSTLSVDAKEFYPASYLQTPSPAPIKSVQDRLTKYNKQNIENDRNDSTSNKDVDFLYDSIEVLTVKPGKFDSILPSLLESLEPFFEDVNSVFHITEIIFTQALTVPNFTYTGARLCAALDEQCPLLRASLHQLCEKELLNTSNLSALTMFFAEIYTQMNFELFGKCLLKALKQLLSNPSPDDIKFVCQSLKLSGAKLEELDKKVVDKIMEDLNKLCPTLPQNMRSLVQSVINLRNEQWGLMESPSVPPPSEPVDWPDGPVYYGPDGQQLTLEESEFLSENLNNDFLLRDDEDPDALWNPEPEMSEEIQEAFAEFVRLSNR